MKSKNIKLLLTLLSFTTLIGLNLAHAAVWKVPQDFATIQEAIDDSAVVDGDTIKVRSGEYAGANVTKALTIQARRGARITSGPSVGPFSGGFVFPIDGSGSGSEIKGFRFEVDLPIYAQLTDDVTVVRNRFYNATQGVTNWGGSSWRITSNKVVSLKAGNQGGIGIFIGDRNNVPGGVTGNIVLYNKIFGDLDVADTSIGGFRGAGVALFASFSGGSSKAEFISSNLIEGNFISLESSAPEVVDVVGVELSEAVTTLPEAKVFQNLVVKNYIKRMDTPYGFVPSGLFFENEFYLNWPMPEDPTPPPPPVSASLLLAPLAEAPTAPVLNPI